MGLVLLMWIKILRVLPGSRSSHSSMPPAPLCGRWPMSRARLRDTPSRIISSSVQNVPSTITQLAACIASHSRSSMSAEARRIHAGPAAATLPRITNATLSPGDRRFAIRGIRRRLAGHRQRAPPHALHTVDCELAVELDAAPIDAAKVGEHAEDRIALASDPHKCCRCTRGARAAPILATCKDRSCDRPAHRPE